MDFDISEEQELLLATVRQLVENECPLTRVRQVFDGDSGYDPEFWKSLIDIGLGYTKLSSELGAEETHALLNRYFEAVDSIVEGYGGSVDKHMGDNVMAVFGAPIAHDDDPLRAVRAALDIGRAAP